MKRAFTLIELMVALTLSLLLLLAVAKMFQGVADTVNDTQSTLNMAANMNNTAMVLREDLDSILRCVQVNRNHKMVTGGSCDESGYLEIIEGDNNISYVDKNNGNAEDKTIGDVNDILMGTGKAIGANRVYRGLVNGEVCESNFAEIIWFVRGTTLYRQTKLIIGDDKELLNKYNIDSDGSMAYIANFHETSDVSCYKEGGRIYPNTLSSLARREHRFAHYYVGESDFPFPHKEKYRELRLPTMAELSNESNWKDLTIHTPATIVDLWNEPNYAVHSVNPSYDITNRGNGWLATGERAGEDIVLTNVISFDIKVWNPNVNGFIDLGDNSAGSFGAQGRYSGNAGAGEDEKLVTRVNFDENIDQAIQFRRNSETGEYSIDANGEKIEYENYHHKVYHNHFLYREGSKGDLPLSNLQQDELPQQQLQQLDPSAPTTTLVISNWSGAKMPRVFDTWATFYETYLRNGGVVCKENSEQPALDDDYSILPSNNGGNKIRGNNHGYSRTEFYLVTLRQEPTSIVNPDISSTRPRWHYIHSANEEGTDDNNQPIFSVANRFFERYSHPGTGTYIDKKSGAYWECPPPYDAELRGIEITIRCFDPKSGNIRQVRVVKHFKQ